jgi:CelD/BcsL family acetyltransferase involved in cellulose biosynthesis
MSRLTVEELHGDDAIRALRVEWQKVFRGSGAAPFLSWEWISAWGQWLNHSQTPFLLCARDGNELVGLAPLGVEDRPLPGWPVKARRLSFLGGGFSGADYLDLLSLPERAREAASAIFDYLARNVRFDILELDDVASDSPNLPLVAERFGREARFRYRSSPRFICPQVELNDDWAAVLKRKRGATTFRQQLRKLRERPGFEYRAVTRPEESKAAFDRFLHLHEAHWIDHGGSELTGHEMLRSFHRDLVTRLAGAGLLRFDELWAEGSCRASIYGLDDGQCCYCYSHGYDPVWRKASPGQVLLGLSIEDAIKRGVKRYDFLRGTETYKFDWATTTRETVSVLIARPGLPAMLLAARQQTRMVARAVAKALLPEQAIEWIRVRRRARGRERGLGTKAPASISDGNSGYAQSDREGALRKT